MVVIGGIANATHINQAARNLITNLIVSDSDVIGGTTNAMLLRRLVRILRMKQNARAMAAIGMIINAGAQHQHVKI